MPSVQRYVLHRKVDVKNAVGGKNVATYERVFDLVDEAHVSLSHPKYTRSMYNCLQKGWYGITEKVIKVYHYLCPTCLKLLKAPKAEEKT